MRGLVAICLGLVVVASAAWGAEFEEVDLRTETEADSEADEGDCAAAAAAAASVGAQDPLTAGLPDGETSGGGRRESVGDFEAVERLARENGLELPSEALEGEAPNAPPSSGEEAVASTAAAAATSSDDKKCRASAFAEASASGRFRLIATDSEMPGDEVQVCVMDSRAVAVASLAGGQADASIGFSMVSIQRDSSTIVVARVPPLSVNVAGEAEKAEAKACATEVTMAIGEEIDIKRPETRVSSDAEGKSAASAAAAAGATLAVVGPCEVEPDTPECPIAPIEPAPVASPYGIAALLIGLAGFGVWRVRKRAAV